MPSQVKKVLMWIFWIFIIYAILTDPNRAAQLVQTAWQIILGGVAAVVTFFNRILGR